MKYYIPHCGVYMVYLRTNPSYYMLVCATDGKPPIDLYMASLVEFRQRQTDFWVGTCLWAWLTQRLWLLGWHSGITCGEIMQVHSTWWSPYLPSSLDHGWRRAWCKVDGISITAALYMDLPWHLIAGWLDFCKYYIGPWEIWMKFYISIVKLPSDDCHCTSLMINQHWLRWWLYAIRQQAIGNGVSVLCHHMASPGLNVLNAVLA